VSLRCDKRSRDNTFNMQICTPCFPHVLVIFYLLFWLLHDVQLLTPPSNPVKTGKYRPGDEIKAGVVPPDEVYESFAAFIESLLKDISTI